jgi:hypothetical protein
VEEAEENYSLSGNGLPEQKVVVPKFQVQIAYEKE